MEQKTPGWIRLDETREGEDNERYSESFFPNLQSIIGFCLENDIGNAVDLTDIKRLLTVKTAELLTAVKQLEIPVVNETKVRKRQNAAN